MYKYLIFSSVAYLILLTSCREKEEKLRKQEFEKNTTERTHIDCLSIEDRVAILTEIIKEPDFQVHLHPEVEGRLPIQLMKSRFFNSDLKVMANGHQVVYKDSLDLPYGKVHQIEIKNLDCKAKTVEFLVFYPIEGWYMQGSLEFINGRWKLNVSGSGVVD